MAVLCVLRNLLLKRAGLLSCLVATTHIAPSCLEAYLHPPTLFLFVFFLPAPHWALVTSNGVCQHGHSQPSKSNNWWLWYRTASFAVGCWLAYPPPTHTHTYVYKSIDCFWLPWQPCGNVPNSNRQPVANRVGFSVNLKTGSAGATATHLLIQVWPVIRMGSVSGLELNTSVFLVWVWMDIKSKWDRRKKATLYRETIWVGWPRW